MAKTQFTEKKQRLSYKRLLGAIIALLMAFLLLTSVVSVSTKYFTIKHHIKTLNEEQIALESKHASLEKKNAYLATPAGQEQALRDKYNVVKPGEGMVVVVPAQIPTEGGQDSSRVSHWWKAILAGLGIGKDK